MPNQLKLTLEKQSFPLYVIYGNEPFLISESRDLIKRHLQATGEVEYTHLTQNNEILAKLATLTQPSLFASFQCIELTLNKLSAAESAQLAELIPHCPKDIVLLIHGGQIRQKQPPAWFKYAEIHGLVVPHWPLSLAQFSNWVLTRAKQLGLTLSPQVLNLLIYHTEGNCLAAAQELERLRLIALSDDPTQEMTLPQSSQYDVFDLCTFALEGQSERVLKIVSCLKENEDTPLQLIVWALSQTLRALLRCHSSREDVQARILHQAGILSSVHPAYFQALKRPAPKRWASLLGSLSQIDKLSKSGEVSAAWRQVLEVCLNLAGPPFLPHFNQQLFA
jgi:DNA polymerase-3 subunit delta